MRGRITRARHHVFLLVIFFVLFSNFITEKLEKIQRNFLWDVAVEIVTYPKNWGGLEYKDLKVINKALGIL